MELDELDDHAVGGADVGEANRAGATRVGMNVNTGCAKSFEHAVEIGRLNAKVGDAETRAERAVADLGRLRGRHARWELANHEKLATEEHAVVLATLPGGNRPETLSPEA